MKRGINYNLVPATSFLHTFSHLRKQEKEPEVVRLAGSENRDRVEKARRHELRPPLQGQVSCSLSPAACSGTQSPLPLQHLGHSGLGG